MALFAEKQLEQAVILNDAKNVTVLGIEQGSLLLYAATTSSFSRNASSERTIIGCVNLLTKEQKVLYRHSSSVKIAHASTNAARTFCCFVTKTEQMIYEVFMAEIDSASPGRLFSLNYSRSNPIRAFLTAHDIVLLFYRDGVTVFRIPSAGRNMDQATTVDRAAQIENCIYYQWDTLLQRLHVVHDRTSISSTSTTSSTGGGHRSAYVYTMYTVTARGQFESIITVDFDLNVSGLPVNHSNIEILSNNNDLFLCWQSTMKEENVEKIQYAIVSLGHGRTVINSKQLNQKNMEFFQSRRVHFGFLAGDYMFAFLRGEFIHLIDWNIHSKFTNNLFLPDDTTNMPYDTKYTSQRGLPDKNLTLIYEKKNLVLYTIRTVSNALIQKFDSTTFQSIIALSMITPKDFFLEKIVAKILNEMSDDLNTKFYLKEILLTLIFNRLSRKIPSIKYRLVFPSTTAIDRQANDTSCYRSITHHRNYIAESSRTTNIDKEYCEILRQSFELSRRYREKLPCRHDIALMDSAPEDDFGVDDPPPSPLTRKSSSISRSPSTSSAKSESPTSLFRIFSPLNRKDSMIKQPDERSKFEFPPSFTARDHALYNNVKESIKTLHKSWDETRVHSLAVLYVETTVKETNRFIELLTRSVDFNRTQILSGDDSELAKGMYGPLLMMLEKLYLAVMELGFTPTEELRRALLEVSFQVMPFTAFIKAIDQNILVLTEEFVTRLILELDDSPKSYAIKEQLIFMLPNTNFEVHSRLFGYMKTDRGKRIAAQLLIARRFSSDSRTANSSNSYPNAMTDDISEMLNVNDGSQSQNRLIEQAVVTFFRDCNQRGNFTEDEMTTVKNGLVASALSVVP